MRRTIAVEMMRLAILAVVSAVAAGAAIADTPAPVVNLNNNVAVSGTRTTPSQGLLTDRFVASLGTFIVSTDVTAELNGASVKDPAVNFNDTLGVGGDFTRGRADLLWRINPKHHIRFLIFRNDSTDNHVIDRAVEWGDYTFQANGNVKTEFNFNVYELGYEYAFMRGPTYEVGATAGVHLLDMKIALSGNATFTDSNGHTGSASYSSQESSLPAPLPVVGLRAGWSVAPNWYLEAQAQIFKFDYEGFNGNWSDLRAGVTWMFTRHFGVGAAYNRFHVNVDVNRAQYNGSVDLSYSGGPTICDGQLLTGAACKVCRGARSLISRSTAAGAYPVNEVPAAAQGVNFMQVPVIDI